MAIKLDKSKLVRNLADKKILVPHIEKGLAEEFEWEYSYKPKEGDDGWHPSGDCLPTPNELYWKAKDPQREVLTANSYKNFQVGHFWHAYLQYVLLHKANIGLTEDDIERRGIRGWGAEGCSDPHRYAHLEAIEWRPYHYATGSGDIAPCQVPGHGEYIVDFKTMGSHDYRQPNVPEWCAQKYEAQINIYMDFFDLEKALIVAINKDSGHDMKEFQFVRNQPLIDAIYQKWEMVSVCLDDEFEPPVGEYIVLPFRGSG